MEASATFLYVGKKFAL